MRFKMKRNKNGIGCLIQDEAVFISLDAGYDYTDEQLLHNAGALIREGDGYAFTNAGFLFFASNPQRVLDWAKIRLLRFAVPKEKLHERGATTFERFFSGPIIKQIRDARNFFQKSGFFKVYQKRNIKGNGFVEEPEYPEITIDEAIVNAIAHRDYAVKLPIECEYYADAFIVRNPGCVLQRDKDIPEHFSLREIMLEHKPRNSKLVDWLLRIRTLEGGSEFIRALGEGTKQMKQEMDNLGLPAPEYQSTSRQTTLVLISNAPEREAQMQHQYTQKFPEFATLPAQQPTEFANIFPLTFVTEEGKNLNPEQIRFQFKDFMVALKDALTGKGWYVDRLQFGRLIAHQRRANISLPGDVSRIVRFYPAYSFQIKRYFEKYYLSIDYTLEVKNVQSIQNLLTFLNKKELAHKVAVAQWNGWQRGRIIFVEDEGTLISFFDFEHEELILNNQVIPDLPQKTIERLLRAQHVSFDLSKATKQYSLATKPNEARIRADKTMRTAHKIAGKIFPVRFNNMQVFLQPTPVPLLQPDDKNNTFRVRKLPEPTVEFARHHESANILEAITTYGVYYDSSKTIEIVPICPPELREQMQYLIERLKKGKYKYRGSEKTFHTRFQYSSIIPIPVPEEILSECQRLINEHPEWEGNKALNRLFLVHTPEKGYSLDNEQSPYYLVKRFLFEKGIPCQMVDSPTLQNPDWKDVNLALDIVAKCGVTPWVLPDILPDADFFIGLAYTSYRRETLQRLMGHANVFDPFGKWQFYSGNIGTFDYNERSKFFATLTEQTLKTR